MQLLLLSKMGSQLRTINLSISSKNEKINGVLILLIDPNQSVCH